MNTKIKPLKVMADPIWQGKHPYHDSRFIATADAVVDRDITPVFALRGVTLEQGSIIATLSDSEGQRDYAKLFAAAPELLEACIMANLAFSRYASMHALKGTPEGDEKARENTRLAGICRDAIAKATGGAQ